MFKLTCSLMLNTEWFQAVSPGFDSLMHNVRLSRIKLVFRHPELTISVFSPRARYTGLSKTSCMDINRYLPLKNPNSQIATSIC